MIRASRVFVLIAVVLCASFVVPAVRATSDEEEADLCTMIRENLARHATKIIASNEAKEYVQSFAETLKMKEVLNLWTSNNCGVAEANTDTTTLSSSSIRILSSIKRLAKISFESGKILVNKLHKDFTNLI